MTEEALRELERRWRATGSTADEAAYLRERIRRGEVPADRVRLAAHLEHPAARDALGADAPPLKADLWGWGTRISDHGEPASVRAAIAAAHPLVLEWRTRNPGGDLHERALRAALVWADCPCAKHAQALGDLTAELDKALEATAGPAILTKAKNKKEKAAKAPLVAAWLVPHAVWKTLRSIESGGADLAQGAGHVAEACALAWSCLLDGNGGSFIGRGGPDSASKAAREAIEAHQARVREHVRLALVPWALGSGDPLAVALKG